MAVAVAVDHQLLEPFLAAPVASVPTVALRSKAVSAPRPSGRVDVASRRARMAPTRSGASRSEAISTVAGVAAPRPR